MQERVATGSSVLDELLEGGYERDAVTTIYGPAGAGKTTMALLAAIETAKRGKKTIFVDTEGGFSVARLKQLTTNHKKAFNSIIFLNPTDFEQQHKSIEKLRKIVNSKIGLIVIDTISMLYRLERSIGEESSHEFNHKLGVEIEALTEIARKKRIPVIVANQVYTSLENNRISVVGGDIIRYGSKCLIELQSLHRNKRKAILRKHRSIAGEKEAYFEIVEEGFV
jgi:DNA repair protein RadB